MRRITVSCLALALILLGLTCLGSAQNVTIDLTPIAYPIVLPDSGGSFDYLLTVTNQGSAITATIWCMVTLPNGSSWGPVAGPATRTLGAGQTQSYYRTQTIPSRAPYGYFTLHAYVGIYPDTVWAQDQFEFQHQAVSGTEQEWVERYNGPGNGSDYAYSTAVDGSGNVYVTGYSYESGCGMDYATIKYNPAGVEQWVARYNNIEDRATSIAVDGSGNVYVTGESFGTDSYDYATVKYNSEGQEQWVARYDGPGNWYDGAAGLAVDVAGNAYVTGYSYGVNSDYDYATIKYDFNGNQLWVARYNGMLNDEDRATALALDSAGNSYVTGYSGLDAFNAYHIVTIKYNPAGVELWVADYLNDSARPTALALDSDGNILVTGTGVGEMNNMDYFTVKYNSAGVEQWVGIYNGPGNEYDQPISLAIDHAGNVYIAGTSMGLATGFDYATIKYDSEGQEQWVARYNWLGNLSEHANSLALDIGQNVYVTGYSQSLRGGSDYATIKYDSAGMEQWSARYNGSGNSHDKAASLALDTFGNVYVAGYSDGQAGSGYNYDYATIKYSGGDIANWMPVEATVLGQPLPQECRLKGNFPNPFNASTAMSYELRAASHVSLRIYDTAGRLVETLVDGWRSAGEHQLKWEAGDLPSGIYVCRIQVGDWMESRKMILLK